MPVKLNQYVRVISVIIVWLLLLCPAYAQQKIPDKLWQAYLSKGADYQPRTEHFNADGTPEFINRLILEESPYLIQHAHNPVHWYAWGKEAFERAKRENKPIFLSIGYSTCHWCHVMERESFDNIKLADYLNQHYIAIKVDRERRPDVDKIYMTAAMLLNGSGGWPLSSILTPEGKPFFMATYMPRDTFLEVLQKAQQLWQNDEAQLRTMADKISAAVQGRQQGLLQAEHIGRERVQIAVIKLLNRFDELQGGFSQAPKFPNETSLLLLEDVAVRDQDKEVFDALRLTLDMMAQGGIYDQVGGGFHRYSTDNAWLVPHFEKMLYNQALLSRVYLQMYAMSQEQKDRRIVTQTLDFVLRDMQDSNGAFFSASDADSDGKEGQYFLWTQAELKAVLPAKLYPLAISLYAVTKDGNFSEPAAAGGLNTQSSGENILHLPVSLAQYAQQHQLQLSDLYHDVDRIRQILYQHRQTRITPAIDRKIVTAWNGMMIISLAKASRQLQNPAYLDAAVKAAEYLWQVHYQQQRLWRASLNSKPSVAATQADYAWLAQAFVALYDATAQKQWLQRARELTLTMVKLFWDKQEGNFYLSQAAVAQTTSSSTDMDHELLFNRPKDIYDGALPSANAAALELLSQLYYRTGEDYFQSKAMALISSLSAQVKTSPSAFGYFLMAVNELNFGELGYADHGSVVYGAKGHLRLNPEVISRSRQGEKTKIELAWLLQIDKNWHINSRYPLEKDLQATSVSLKPLASEHWKIISAEYPQGEKIQLDLNTELNNKPLSLYQGNIVIKVQLASLPVEKKQAIDGKLPFIPVQIQYQSCNDKICLAPERQIFYLHP